MMCRGSALLVKPPGAPAVGVAAWARRGQCGSSLGGPGKTGRGRRGLGCSHGFQSPPSRVWLEGGQVRGGTAVGGGRAGGPSREGQWQVHLLHLEEGCPVPPRCAHPASCSCVLSPQRQSGAGTCSHRPQSPTPGRPQPSRVSLRTRVECVYVHARVQTAFPGADACLRVCAQTACTYVNSEWQPV